MNGSPQKHVPQMTESESDPLQRLIAALSPPLDAAALQRLGELDPGGRHGLLPRVLRTFDSSSRKLLEQLRAARAAGDAEAQRLAVHTIKSSSASVGALRLSQLCADAESRLRAGEGGSAALAPLLDEIDAECRGLLETLPGRLPPA